MIDAVAKVLINQFQRDMPLSPTPYADMAKELGIEEAEVIKSLQSLQDEGVVSRVGPVFNHCNAGASTLAAMCVPPDRLSEIAAIVSSYAEVNHNYEREHQFNLWFVITAPNQQRLLQVIETIETRTQIKVLNLPMEKSYHIDLAFPIDWKDEACN